MQLDDLLGLAVGSPSHVKPNERGAAFLSLGLHCTWDHCATRRCYVCGTASLGGSPLATCCQYTPVSALAAP